MWQRGIAACAVAAATAVACQRDRAPAPEIASHLALPQLDNRGDFDPQRLRGRPVLVNLWAPWCGICVAELPELAAAVAEVEGAELVLVLVLGDPDHGRAILRTRDMPGVSLFDANGSLTRALGLNAVPLTIAVDPEGRSVAALHGGHDRRAFAQVLREMQ